MKALIDTNVVLDVLLAREPHAEHSNAVFSMIESGHLQGVLCATTLTTIDFMAGSVKGKSKTRALIGELLSVFEIAPVTRSILSQAQQSKLTDFEDAVLACSALAIGTQTIITRNTKDFVGSGLAVYSPTEWLLALKG